MKKLVVLEFTWKSPGDLNDYRNMLIFKLFRDRKLIYEGRELYFIENTSGLKAYRAYKYEVCEQILIYLF